MSVTNQVLKRGSSGVPIVNLQNLLNQNGAKLDVDGNFGPKTEAAVKSYQQGKGLTVDGMVGNETMGALTGGGASNNNAPATPATKSASGGNATAPSNNQTTAPSEGFSYDDYVESETVSQAYAALQQQLAAKPGAYQSTWEGQINDIIDRIMNREDFSYDVNEDALYQQMKDQYTALGKVAMQDTMGQAAAMTGGYGSSYASTAGNQAYQGYLSQLNEVVPELYGMARDQYNQEGQEMYNQYGMLADQESQDYGRWVDGYNQWASEREHLEGVYKDERTFDYGKYADDKSYAYDEYRNAIADEQWEKTHELNVNADNRAEEAWGLEQQAYEDSVKAYAGTTSGGVSFNNGGLTNGQVKELQAALGVDADGKYGPKSKEAAGGLSAEEAYRKFVGGDVGDSGGNQAALEHVASMSSTELVEAMKAYNYDEDNTGLAAFLDDCVASGRLTEAQADNYYEKYRAGSANDVTDTTVKPSYKGSGAGGGKFGTPTVKE